MVIDWLQSSFSLSFPTPFMFSHGVVLLFVVGCVLKRMPMSKSERRPDWKPDLISNRGFQVVPFFDKVLFLATIV